jgi:DNA-binding response OmpR family regulator
VDLARREFQVGRGPRQSLSETECLILGHLAAHAGRAISREELLSRVWGVGGGVETRTIDMHVARLRAKLSGQTEADGERYIVTVRGMGYMLGAELQVETGAGAVHGGSP